MKKFVRVVLIAVLYSLGMPAIDHAAEPIYIAFSAPMTGQYEGYGKTLKESVDLGVEWINAGGGINGRLVELVVGDSAGEPQRAKRFAMKVAKDPRIVAEIGDFTTTACLAAQPIYKRAGMVQLSPTSSHPSFAPGSPYSFAIFGTQAVEAAFMAQTAVNTLGKKKIAVLFINNDWGVVTQKFFVDGVKQAGGEIVAIEGYLEKSTDFAPILEKLRAAQPELVYLCLMYQDAVKILKQQRDMGWNDVTMMGSVTLYSSEFLQLAGEMAENLYTNTTFFPKDPRPEVQKFVQGYEARYRKTPNVFAAVAYDAINLLKIAIEKGGPDRQAIRDELAKIQDYSGVTGKISFNENRNVVRDLNILQVKNGEFLLYSK